MTTLTNDPLEEGLKKKLLMLKLKDKGIDEINIEFSGGGDDGDIDDVTCSFESSIVEISNKDEDSIRDIAWVLINDNVNTVGDWVNNAGGSGTLLINPDNLTYELDYYQRVEENYTWEDCKLFD